MNFKLGLIGRVRGSQLIFRGGRGNAETITYAVERHEGGIALLNMRVRLYHLSEDRTGTDMCLRTFSIIMSRTCAVAVFRDRRERRIALGNGEGGDVICRGPKV